MTRYLLDTNILSNVTKPNPSASLLLWMGEQADEDLFIASLTVAEIQRGVLEKPQGKKRRDLRPGFPAPRVPRPCLPAVSSRLMKRRASYGRG